MARLYYFAVVTVCVILATRMVVGCACKSTPLPAHPDHTSPIQLESHGTTEIALLDNTLQFDPATCSAGHKGLDMPLGSVSVKVLGRRHGLCVFEYTHEIEGGYTTYRCRVPVSEGLVRVRVLGDIEVATSFSIDDCEVVRRGNVFFDMFREPTEGR